MKTVARSSSTRLSGRSPSRAFLVVLLFGLAACAGQRAAIDDPTSVLSRQTQELLDAIAVGDRGPWERYLHDDVVFVIEDGTVRSKAQMLQDLRPLPAGITGSITIGGFRAVSQGDTAVTTYIAQEEETYFGQVLHASYRTSDTWRRTDATWRMLSSQVMAMRTDPPSNELSPAALQEYEGVYELTPEITYIIRRDGRELSGVRTGRAAEALRAEAPDAFFVPGQPRIRKIFQRDARGRIVGFIDRRETWDIKWRRK